MGEVEECSWVCVLSFNGVGTNIRFKPRDKAGFPPLLLWGHFSGCLVAPPGNMAKFVLNQNPPGECTE